MLPPGAYPAAVTPLDAKGKLDAPSIARLLAHFEAAGCQGVVLAGTNGEGPSLSAPEKRDLLHAALPLKGKLKLILGVATPSLDEARWLVKQAGAAGADGVLLMPPFYFRSASLAGIATWFERVLDVAEVPVLIYNFPNMTGATLPAQLIGALARREVVSGVKDSSGDRENLAPYRAAVPEGKALFVGDETVLLDALRAGWTGTISGVANVAPEWLARIVAEWPSESAEAKFELLSPCIEALRKSPQPATNKAILHRLGVIDRPDVRPPLMPIEDPTPVLEVMKRQLGFRL